MPSISPPSIVHAPISSHVHGENEKKTLTASHLPSPQVGRETRAYEGLRIFFGSGKKLNGQTHSQRIVSAAEQKDRSRLMEMILPGAEGTDSLRKLSTAAGTVIGVRYEEGTEVKAAIPPEAERNSKFVALLMEQYEKGKLDSVGKQQLMQGLAYRAYTAPVLETADGRKITFGQLCTTSTWDGISQKDLSNSNIDQRLKETLNAFQKVYEIAASLPQEKLPFAAPKSAKEKGLRKLWQEAEKGNFFSEAKRQAGKFNHKAASLFKAKPYVNSTLDEVFSVELRLLKTRDREQIEKKIIENQVLATIKQLESRPNTSFPSPGKIAKEVKLKSNYQYLAYQDKDAYLAAFIKEVRTPAPAVQEQPKPEKQAAVKIVTTKPSEEPEYSSPDLDEARRLWASHQIAQNLPID